MKKSGKLVIAFSLVLILAITLLFSFQHGFPKKETAQGQNTKYLCDARVMNCIPSGTPKGVCTPGGKCS